MGALLGNTNGFKKGMTPWNKGIKTGLVPKSAFKKGCRSWNKGNIGFNKDVVRTEEWKKNLSLSQIGQKRKYCGVLHHNWRGGKSPERNKIIMSGKYRLWRKTIFIRDNYTCVNCGQIGGLLQADHIKPWCENEELRYCIDNGRTLCKACHYKIGWNLFRMKNPANHVIL